MLQLIMPIAFILGGYIAGRIFEKIILNKIKIILSRNQIAGPEIFVHSLRGVTLVWFLIAGIYGAVLSLQFNQIFSQNIADTFIKILTACFIYSVTVLIARLGVSFVEILTSRTEGVSASLLSNLAKITIYVFGFLTILQTLGFSITPILATLGIGGLAVALAFQDTLSNIFSGLYLIISKQVRPGDYVKLETNQEGYVIDITWRNTVIKEIPNNIIVVPNSKLASAIFTNYHLPSKEITIKVELGVSYDSDLEKVEQVTVEVAQEIMEKFYQKDTNFQAFICYENMGDYSIKFNVYLRVAEIRDKRFAIHEFIKKIHKRYKQENIHIPFPSEDIYIKR
ncbi:mechanosensitive ion channel family protein [Ancylothrix sp. C2]|uniref:mechanosensitive ion channel family protein n=1 Tax=Ancylothrix sp. D3o TaxID=2953691 RepID=UPI0021BB361F|nr:mechanosensitive ion channel family protein [Ancylothrix sp. D3o]MCT7951456.1 mechanosensitive ion channel family protein [Ancylothrix sp. D3o]